LPQPTRKRRPPTPAGPAGHAEGAAHNAQPGPIESPDGPPAESPAASPQPTPAGGRNGSQKESRAELRSAARRADLVPLAPGERPPALLACAVIAALLGLANVVLYVAGVKISGRHPGPGVLSFSVVMLAAACGLWGRRYWAVLAFQALLALAVLTFSLFLVEASNIQALALCLVIIGGGGLLFWKLVGVMARIQMPTDRLPD
jgi:hypothetical protein